MTTQEILELNAEMRGLEQALSIITRWKRTTTNLIEEDPEKYDDLRLVKRFFGELQFDINVQIDLRLQEVTELEGKQ